jgi:hypothetical protein
MTHGAFITAFFRKKTGGEHVSEESAALRKAFVCVRHFEVCSHSFSTLGAGCGERHLNDFKKLGWFSAAIC